MAGSYIDGCGYRQMVAPNHPRNRHNTRRYIAEHVLIAERALGRLLSRDQPVHHVNAVRDDNRPSNLVICESHAYHKLLHMRMRIVKAGGNPNTQRICTDCQQLRLIAEMGKKKNGFTNQCVACLRERVNRYRRDHLDMVRAKDRLRGPGRRRRQRAAQARCEGA